MLTIGVPRPVPGSDWGCALQITGLNTTGADRGCVLGIDGLQALHLAMKCADAVLKSANMKLAWLGQTEDLGMPVPATVAEVTQDRLEAIVEREANKFWRSLERAHEAKASKRNRTRTARKT